jgi:hypothetical protein
MLAAAAKKTRPSGEEGKQVTNKVTANKVTAKKTTPPKKKAASRTLAAPHFTVDWFTNNLPTWQRLLVPRLAGRPVEALEVGSYEGMSASWMLDNLLTHARSRLLCLDTFSDEAHEVWYLGKRVRNSGAFARFTDNVLRRYPGKARALRGDCATSLKRPDVQSARFDFIYIDPSGHSHDMLEKAVLCFPLLKPGGVMVFDDYTYSKERDSRCPRLGADAFLNAYAPFVHVLHMGWQGVLERRAQPLPLPQCFSEYSS